MTATLDKLARRLLRAEIAARGARDVDAAEAAIAPSLRFDAERGEHVAVDADGTPRISLKAGYPEMGLDDVLAEAMRNRPDLFGGQTAAPGRVGQPPAVNPFDRNGSAFNLTEAMLLWRQDPERAEYLAAEAGLDMRNAR